MVFIPRCLRASSTLPPSSAASSSSAASASAPASTAAASNLATPKVPANLEVANCIAPSDDVIDSNANQPLPAASPILAPSATLQSSSTENLQQGDEPIKARSMDQRKAEPGDPLCVICGRFGEYICDETDEDVCSLECKATVIEQARQSAGIVSPFNASDHGKAAESIIVQDSCIYVKEDRHQPLNWELGGATMQLSVQQIYKIRTEIDVQVTGENVPPPILNFSDCLFPQKLLDNLELSGYDSPTPVQMQAIPAALKSHDMLVSAETGSGKTAAFLLPIIARCTIVRQHYTIDRLNPLAIILTPTRELCAHVEEHAKVLGKGLPFKTALVVGGNALPQQLYRVKQGVELVVGTPGRMIDLLSKHPIELDDVFMLVLDEVDTMLERGFRNQVMQIIQALTTPQIMMFSATVPPAIHGLSTTILKQPLYIAVGKPGIPAAAVKQTVIWVESKRKKQKLFDILGSAYHSQPPIVVFVNSRMGADLLADSICQMTGMKASALHGEKQMQDRKKVLSSFLMGELPVIVTTGVLGRGLDFIRVRQVIIFDMPYSLQEYIHQIGRASRLGVPGSAMIFINNESKSLFKEFIQLLRTSGAAIPRELANSPYAQSSYAASYNPKKRKPSR